MWSDFDPTIRDFCLQTPRFNVQIKRKPLGDNSGEKPNPTKTEQKKKGLEKAGSKLVNKNNIIILSFCWSFNELTSLFLCKDGMKTDYI